MEAVKKPGIAGYIIALIVLVVGVGAAIGAFALGVKGIAGMLGEPQTLPGTNEVVLKEAGVYMLFHEGTSEAAAGTLPQGLVITLADKSGQPIALDPAQAEMKFNIGQRYAHGVYSFKVDQPGAYVLTGSYPPGQPGPQTTVSIAGGAGGIAKGMWQFIPETGWRYGLRTGPLVELRRPDPRDERHNFEKSTRAAAAYLRRIYETDAQASGLLVIASYNWGEGNVLSRIRSMPAGPRERNFWKLLYHKRIPKETYDYVFYIVSAAVIGENPRLFGFDFDNPLKLN